MPGSSLNRIDACDIWIGPPTIPNLTVVRRVRLVDGSPIDLLHSIRESVEALGRTSVRWWITPLTTPQDLAAVLVEHSVQVEDPRIIAMAIKCSSLEAGPPDVQVRQAETLDDYIACSQVGATAFGEELAKREAVAAVFESERAEPRVAAYLAEVDGKPVATARATFHSEGVTLNGGGTVPEARGRGAYRALVAARCRDAESMGIEWAVVQARPSAAPILERLEFEPVGNIQVLFDSW
jgi:predicted GNAT family acetyltransferase